MIRYKNAVLLFEDAEISPVSTEQNPVGICSSCDGDLISLGYYRHADRWMVAARCSGCSQAILMVYSDDWSWIEDRPLSIEEQNRRSTLKVSEVPLERLEVVFTPAEIRDMLAFQEGRPYLRQNIYRAKAKLDRFERLFGIRIEL